jgi:hypothetical protein
MSYLYCQHARVGVVWQGRYFSLHPRIDREIFLASLSIAARELAARAAAEAERSGCSA